MKKVLLIQLLLSASIINAQPVVQPIASGDYWQIDQFQSRLPELATKTSFPATIQFTNGYAGINNLYVNKQIGSNEIVWQLGAAKNVAGFVIEWSRDLKNFERAGVVQVVQANEDRFVFRHRFENSPLVYYRVGIVTNARTVAYMPAVQVFDEEQSIKIFPTAVKGGTFYIQTARAFEKLQVLNSSNQAVFEKGINGQTGTITVGLSTTLPKGIYFVRLLATNEQQHVERIILE